MGCKGSSVRITPSRPKKSNTYANLRIGFFVDFAIFAIIPKHFPNIFICWQRYRNARHTDESAWAAPTSPPRIAPRPPQEDHQAIRFALAMGSRQLRRNGSHAARCVLWVIRRHGLATVKLRMRYKNSDARNRPLVNSRYQQIPAAARIVTSVGCVKWSGR